MATRLSNGIGLILVKRLLAMPIIVTIGHALQVAVPRSVRQTSRILSVGHLVRLLLVTRLLRGGPVSLRPQRPKQTRSPYARNFFLRPSRCTNVGRIPR